MYRTACLTALLVSFLAIALPASADAPVTAPASAAAAGATHLVRYVYEVSWTGGEGLVGKEGSIDVMLQADLDANQQTLYLVRKDGFQLGRVLQADTSAFVSLNDRETTAVYDLTLGAYAFGFPLGLGTVAEWLQGRDASGPFEVARIERTAEGAPKRLSEAHWVVEYGNWEKAPATDFSVPSTVVLKYDGSTLRLEMKLTEAQAFDSQNLPTGYRAIKIM